MGQARSISWANVRLNSVLIATLRLTITSFHHLVHCLGCYAWYLKPFCFPIPRRVVLGHSSLPTAIHASDVTVDFGLSNPESR